MRQGIFLELLHPADTFHGHPSQREHAFPMTLKAAEVLERKSRIAVQPLDYTLDFLALLRDIPERKNFPFPFIAHCTHDP